MRKHGNWVKRNETVQVVRENAHFVVVFRP